MELNSLFEMYTPPDLEEYAAGYESENYGDDRGAEDFDWQFIPEFPLSEFLKPSANAGTQSKEQWAEWFQKENEWSAADYGQPYWEHLADEEINEPIVVSYNDEGKWHIWDGWHRTGASITTDRTTIPAVVGTPKQQVAPPKKKAKRPSVYDDSDEIERINREVRRRQYG